MIKSCIPLLTFQISTKIPWKLCQDCNTNMKTWGCWHQLVWKSVDENGDEDNDDDYDDDFDDNGDDDDDDDSDPVSAGAEPTFQ